MMYDVFTNVALSETLCLGHKTHIHVIDLLLFYFPKRIIQLDYLWKDK